MYIQARITHYITMEAQPNQVQTTATQTCYHQFTRGMRVGQLCGKVGRRGDGLCYEHRNTRSVSPNVSNDDSSEEEDVIDTNAARRDIEATELEAELVAELEEFDADTWADDHLNNLVAIRDNLNNEIDEFLRRAL